MFVFILSESEKNSDTDCVNRPVEGEWELVTFRVKDKSLLLEKEMAGIDKTHTTDTAFEVIRSFEDANHS